MRSPATIPPALGKPAEYGQEIVKRRYRRTVTRGSLKGKTVLDFGCGNGAQTVEFGAEGCRIVALDVSVDNLRTFARYLRRDTGVSILPVLYDGDRLPVADSAVDVVLCYEVIEHVPDETRALEEIRRVVKPGGELFLSVPNKAWVFETHGARLPVLPWNRVPFFSWLPKPIHERYANARIYRRQQIVELVQRHGFDVRSSEYITAPMDVARPVWMKSLLRSTLFKGDTTAVPVLSTSVFVHCVKRTGE